jgi:hypothetical protein
MFKNVVFFEVLTDKSLLKTTDNKKGKVVKIVTQDHIFKNFGAETHIILVLGG